MILNARSSILAGMVTPVVVEIPSLIMVPSGPVTTLSAVSMQDFESEIPAMNVMLSFTLLKAELCIICFPDYTQTEILPKFSLFDDYILYDRLNKIFCNS